MKNGLNYFILSISVFLLFMFAGNIFNSNNEELFLGDTNLLGDVDGNGGVGASDYILVKKHILMLSTLSAERSKKADVNGDSKINSLDYIRIKKIILNGEKIEVTPVPTVKPTSASVVTSTPTIAPVITPRETASPAKPIVTPVVRPTPNPTSTPVSTIRPTATPLKVCCCTSDKSMCSWVSSCTSAQPVHIQGATESNCKNNQVVPTPINTSTVPSKIHFINTGTGDAIILESNGHFGLVDSSNPYNDGTMQQLSKWSDTVEHVKEYARNIGVNYFDFVIATHSHSDHIGGMVVIADNFVNSNTTYYYREYVGSTEDTEYPDWDNEGYYKRAVAAMQKAGANMQEITGKKPQISLGDFEIKLYNTERARNNESRNGMVIGPNKECIVEYVTYKGKYKTLLAADMEREDEIDVANIIGDISILKIGHHSYWSATSFEFAQKIKPEIAVLTGPSFINTFYPVGYYMQSSLYTKFYYTGGTKDSVIVTYSDNGYSVAPTEARKVFNATIDYGKWKYIDNIAWIVYKDGSPVHNSWYQDTDGRWYYMDLYGACTIGWAKLEYNGRQNWYYFKDNCEMVSSTCLMFGNEQYCFDGSGACYSGRDC